MLDPPGQGGRVVEVAHMAGRLTRRGFLAGSAGAATAASVLGWAPRMLARADDPAGALPYGQQRRLEIGLALLRKYKESHEVIHAVACHHGDYEPESIEAVLVAAADAISAARPGARRESLESYIRRLEKLENIANSFDGVEKSYAIQAGREIRIMVKPNKVDDAAAVKMARDIVKRIESDMEYPGQIKVTVIRETRAVDYAK